MWLMGKYPQYSDGLNIGEKITVFIQFMNQQKMVTTNFYDYIRIKKKFSL